ncbi:MAG: preprotein translocase subunit YajC [Bacteroides sp.]|nr:MAG: preprotein translocase subunit YajC [Bacteroides sp.]
MNSLNIINNNYNLFCNILMFISISLVFYFFIIRPQNKKINDHRNFINNLKKGNKILTTGGIIGHIDSIHDNFCIVQVFNNFKLKIKKNYIFPYTK